MRWLTTDRSTHFIIAILTAAITACGSGGSTPSESHPAKLVGRWARQIDKEVWSDTIDFRPNGTVGGTKGNPVPASARWGVRIRNGMRVFCAEDSRESSCQSYQVTGDTLALGGGPSSTTLYRRVH